MNALADFAITKRWPPKFPDRLQLYSLPTPNGVKVSIMLEAIALPYEAHRIHFDRGEQKTTEFLSLNPNGKIPAIIDPNGPGARPLALFESGAILLYLAKKTGQMLPADAARRHETVQWLLFQMSAVGPMFGQVGFFHKFARRDIEDKRPRDRYVAESHRLLGVLEQRLAKHRWLMGDEMTVADIATFPWVETLIGFYGAADLVEFERFPLVARALDRFLALPAVFRGMLVPTATALAADSPATDRPGSQ